MGFFALEQIQPAVYTELMQAAEFEFRMRYSALFKTMKNFFFPPESSKLTEAASLRFCLCHPSL